MHMLLQRLSKLFLVLALLVSRQQYTNAFVRNDNSTVYLPIIQLPKPLEVVYYESWVEAKGARVSVVGSVVSTAIQVVQNPTIQIELYKFGQFVGVVTGTTLLSTTLPMQLNRFEILASTFISPDFDSVKIDVISWELVPTSTLQALQVAQIQQYVELITVRSKGFLINSNTITVTNSRLLFWCDGNPNAAMQFTVTVPISPGGSIPYDFAACGIRLDGPTGIVHGVAQSVP